MMWVMYPGGGLSIGREPHTGAGIRVSELLEQAGGSAIGNSGGAIDNEVLGQAHRVAPAGLDRERDLAVVADIAYLAVLGR